MMWISTIGVIAALSAGILLRAADTQTLGHGEVAGGNQTSMFLGVDDQVTIRVLGVDEVDGKTARVDLHGYIDVPLAGKIKAAGLRVDQLEAEVAKALRHYVVDPRVSITVSEYHSRTVSVIGAVNAPGVYSISGPVTLVEVLSRAGGLRTDAGNTVEITRKDNGGPPAADFTKTDPSGAYRIAEVHVASLLDATAPDQNILITGADVISVPKADLVYVVGDVRKPGGFVMNDADSMTVLKAVALAEGVQKTAAPGRARIIRRSASAERKEIPVNVSGIASGKTADVRLLANDILVIPTSGAKVALYRGVDAAIQAGTLAVYR